MSSDNSGPFTEAVGALHQWEREAILKGSEFPSPFKVAGLPEARRDELVDLLPPSDIWPLDLAVKFLEYTMWPPRDEDLPILWAQFDAKTFADMEALRKGWTGSIPWVGTESPIELMIAWKQYEREVVRPLEWIKAIQGCSIPETPYLASPRTAHATAQPTLSIKDAENKITDTVASLFPFRCSQEWWEDLKKRRRGRSSLKRQRRRRLFRHLCEVKQKYLRTRDFKNDLKGYYKNTADVIKDRQQDRSRLMKEIDAAIKQIGKLTDCYRSFLSSGTEVQGIIDQIEQHLTPGLSTPLQPMMDALDAFVMNWGADRTAPDPVIYTILSGPMSSALLALWNARVVLSQIEERERESPPETPTRDGGRPSHKAERIDLAAALATAFDWFHLHDAGTLGTDNQSRFETRLKQERPKFVLAALFMIDPSLQPPHIAESTLIRDVLYPAGV
jgi:hypothetical protein